MRMTARIQFAEILNLCEASPTKTVKGSAAGKLAEPVIAAGSARAEPSNGAPELKNIPAAQITKCKDGERAGAVASQVVDRSTRRFGCQRGAMVRITDVQDPAEMTEWSALSSLRVIATDSPDGCTIIPPLRFD
jgi:hypothetical protein